MDRIDSFDSGFLSEKEIGEHDGSINMIF